MIKGWSKGLDGESYIIEFADSNLYSFKSYWTPSAQENVKEATVLQNFVNNITGIINYKDLLNDFTNRIPFEAYNTGGPGTAIRVLTDQQRRNYKKDRDKYRKANHISNKKAV